MFYTEGGIRPLFAHLCYSTIIPKSISGNEFHLITLLSNSVAIGKSFLDHSLHEPT